MIRSNQQQNQIFEQFLESTARPNLWVISGISNETEDDFSYLLIHLESTKMSLSRQTFDFPNKNEIERRERDNRRLSIVGEREVVWKVETLRGKIQFLNFNYRKNY